MIGEKDKDGNIFRLGGKRVTVWQHPSSVFILKLAEHTEVIVAKTEEEAIYYYNSIEPSTHFKLPSVPLSVPELKHEEEPLIIPTGSRLLGKFESQSKPDHYHHVIQYQDDTIRCTCWPFLRTKTCNHYRLIQAIVAEGATISEPIIIRNER